MTRNRKSIVFAQIAIAAFLAMTPTPWLLAQTTRYVQTTAALKTTSPTPDPITGLTITLPEETLAEKEAVITLNMPYVFLEGTSVGGTRGGQVAVLLMVRWWLRPRSAMTTLCRPVTEGRPRPLS